MGVPGALPDHVLAACLHQGPVADFDDQAQLLEQGNEQRRQHHPCSGWFQRNSASTPMMRRPSVETWGW
jgi:hypothetical protein